MLNAKCSSSQRFLKVMVPNENINNWYSKNARLEIRVECCSGKFQAVERPGTQDDRSAVEFGEALKCELSFKAWREQPWKLRPGWHERMWNIQRGAEARVFWNYLGLLLKDWGVVRRHRHVEGPWPSLRSSRCCLFRVMLGLKGIRSLFRCLHLTHHHGLAPFSSSITFSLPYLLFSHHHGQILVHFVCVVNTWSPFEIQFRNHLF